jgi:hypothetical protein
MEMFEHETQRLELMAQDVDSFEAFARRHRKPSLSPRVCQIQLGCRGASATAIRP